MTGTSWSGEVFERLYAGNPDPWGFETSDYERAKYAETLAALEGRHFRSVLELGCSIGVMSQALAGRCDRLLGIDIAEAALVLARARCAGLGHVRFERAQLPDGFPEMPPESCDLILVSELLYFLSPEDIGRLAARVLQAVSDDGMILVVNWTGETDTPCTGDQAAGLFVAACETAGFVVGLALRRDTYRLERLSR
ncbi:class I SAM-dependent DNA methyltransferase [Lichenicola sp.]|uniref:class I SAM-dependent DNA methyltransferase n=1 Tax=Lichenicola sp. TaxID=2804529 RepID=UPI003B0004C8